MSIPVGAQPTRTLSEGATASLLTIEPGDAVYSMFGHSAIRVSDPETDVDWTFNYGTFDMDRMFLPRFVMGRLDYTLSVARYDRALRHYSEVEHRSVLEQSLNLTPAQVNDLFAFLTVNAQPENKAYRYNFLFDNCATRIIDAFDAALPGLIEWKYPDPDTTFRGMIDRYSSRRPLLDLGIDLLFGSPVDQWVTPEESAFLPDYLAEAFQLSSVHSDGGDVTLVTRADTVYNARRTETRGNGSDALVLLGWLITTLGVAVTFWPLPGRPARIYDVILFGVAGVAGVISCFMWTVTAHTVTAYNWDLLWAWPTHVAVPFLSPKRTRKVGRWYFAIAGAAAISAAAFFMILPESLHPAVVPLAVALAIRSGARAVSGFRANRSGS